MKKNTIQTAVTIGMLVLIWGLSWSIYKRTLAFTPPILFAGLRSLSGGLLLAMFLLPQWKKLKWHQHRRKYVISAILNAVLFYGLQTVGLMYLPGGLFSVLVYFQPVLIGLFAWLWLGEGMTVRKVVGLLTGFLGILAISSEGLSGEISTLGIIIALLTALSWALGVIYVKKVSVEVDSMWMIAMQFMIGGAILTGAGSVMESWTAITWNSTYWLGLGFGATFGIPIAFVIYYKLVNGGDASKVASFTFLVPLIAVLTGTLFMDEPFTISLVVGLLLILLSIILVNWRTSQQRGHSPDRKEYEEAI